MPLVLAGSRLTAGVISSDYAQSDTNAVTVVAATQTALCKQWSIPAGDANAGTAYRVTAWGYGTNGSTVQGIKFQIWLGAGLVGTAIFYGTSNFLASQTFQWNATLNLICVGNGSGATWVPSMSGALVLSSATVNEQTAGTSALPLCNGVTAAVATSSLVAVPFYLTVAWGATTGAPTITCLGSTYEKLGG